MCDILLHHSLPFLPHINSERGTGRRGGGVRVEIPRDGRTMCRWIGSKKIHGKKVVTVFQYLINGSKTIPVSPKSGKRWGL